MNTLQSRYSTVVSTLALVVALTAAGAWALERNSIGSKELKRGAVKSAEIKGSAVRSSDIRSDAVTSEDLSLAAPGLSQQTGEVSAPVGSEYEKLATIGSYEKQTADTVLNVSWSGTVGLTAGPCSFQLRVDGAPDDQGSGEVFASSGSLGESVSVEALFSGFGVGTHEIEVWARASNAGDACVLSPAGTGIGQTVVVQEVVV